jgi:hypothetical protein
VLAPNEHYSINLNYSYSDVYSATNICYNNGAAAASATTPFVPGAATVLSNGVANLCVGSTTWFARDFQDAPTQFGMIGISYTPVNKARLGAGYSASAVNGSRFFNDARDVNGSMVSTYQSPYLNFAYTMHPGLIWKGEYNYYGYSEGGPSGALLCATSAASATNTPTVVSCTSPSLGGVPVGLTEGSAGATLPRVFHANNVTLGVHYEF